MQVRQSSLAVLVTPLSRKLPDWQADWIGIDAGALRIEEAGKSCLFACGDFDSLAQEGHELQTGNIVQYPVRKDETDTQLALQMAFEMGYEQVVVWGGLSGRLDHTLANIRVLLWQYPQAILQDEKQRVRVLLPGTYILEPEYCHVSFFAFEQSCLTLKNFEYELDHQSLNVQDLYTCSNRLTNGPGTVVVEEGRILCVETDWR